MAGCKANGGLKVNRVKYSKKEKKNNITIGPDMIQIRIQQTGLLIGTNRINLKVSSVSEFFIIFPDAIHPPIPFPRCCYTYKYLCRTSQDWRVILQREPPRRAWSRFFCQFPKRSSNELSKNQVLVNFKQNL